MILSCDNLSENGQKLKSVLLALAQAQGRDNQFLNWLSSNLVCPMTMVDSITPATDEAFRLSANEKLGVTDAWPIKRESFCQFVIEKHDLPSSLSPQIDWEKLAPSLPKMFALMRWPSCGC